MKIRDTQLNRTQGRMEPGRIARCRNDRRSGFTLLELLLSMSILSLVLVMVGEIVGKAQRTWQDSRAAISQFKEARRAFEEITTRLSQATLNTYWDYKYLPGNRLDKYERQSELHFVTGVSGQGGGSGSGIGLGLDTSNPTHGVFFQAPLGYTDTPEYVGLSSLLNSWGYFLEYNSDEENRPPFIDTTMVPPRWRFRLMEYRAPSEKLSIYKPVGGTSAADSGGLRELTSGSSDAYYHWFQGDLRAGRYVRVLADNIIALIITPAEAAYASSSGQGASRSERIAPNYGYDSREWQWSGGAAEGNERLQLSKHQLPPLVQVTMVAIDERSADLLELSGEATPGSAPSLIDPSLFAFSINYKSDIRSLEEALLRKNLDYRVFQTTIIMRSSKWSTFFDQQ